jgi:methionyl-tRNA formyltransferase
MRIDEGLDTGDILLQQEEGIEPDDTAVTLAPRLASIGAQLMIETLRGLENGSVHPRAQNHEEATLAPILKREDGLIDFNRTAPEIVNRMRGFQPWPGAYTSFRGKNLALHRASLAATGLGPITPGELRVAGEDLFVGCGQSTAIAVLELQPEGKRRMTARDFVHGYHPKTERLGV